MAFVCKQTAVLVVHIRWPDWLHFYCFFSFELFPPPPPLFIGVKLHMPPPLPVLYYAPPPIPAISNQSLI